MGEAKRPINPEPERSNEQQSLKDLAVDFFDSIGSDSVRLWQSRTFPLNPKLLPECCNAVHGQSVPATWREQVQ